MKVRAAVLEQFGQPLVVQDVDLAPPKTGEVLVKIKACGVCHTDLYTASGADPSGYCDCVLGHEGAGIVEEVGAGVESVKPGDHVVTLFSAECGECLHCKSGKTNLCLAVREQQGLGLLPDGTSRLSRASGELRHFMGTSTFAEYTVMPEVSLAKVNPEANFDAICLLACGATTGIAAALWKAEVEQGSTVAVFGAGMVGLGAVAGAKLRGAGKILVFDPSEQRREMARRFGATHVFSGGANAVQETLDETDGFGADYTFEATGIVDVMGQAVEAARMGWGLATMLGVAGKGEQMKITPRFLITGRRVQGASFGGARGRTQVPQLVDMYLKGDLDLDGFVSHRITLDEVNKGFDLMHQQDGIRSVIQFD
ncbi:MAG: alcohol dehydrogenase catalytic domain-containing protein [Planctomycetota bacterium]|nr:alcohol dehydrogenase catalytic domain-containing protein [Planctomycetota bacterium]MDA1114615.1 alcohol dehydrogenase catalytic domain-containing protein [Planctomycetota bacterium]